MAQVCSSRHLNSEMNCTIEMKVMHWKVRKKVVLLSHLKWVWFVNNKKSFHNYSAVLDVLAFTFFCHD